MRRIAAALMGLVFTTAALAQDVPLLLGPMTGAQSPSVTVALNVYGTCAGSVVGVIGVDHESYKAGSLKFDISGKPDVVIRTGKKDISFEEKISDFNILHCVPTPKGERLLFGSVCGGSTCGDAFDYAVIDPKTGIDLAAKLKSCDQDCANRLLGVEYLK